MISLNVRYLPLAIITFLSENRDRQYEVHGKATQVRIEISADLLQVQSI